MAAKAFRVVSVLLAALLLAAVPSAARAQFTGARGASVTASTATVGSVSGVGLTPRCDRPYYFWEDVTVDVTRVSQQGPVTGYLFTLSRGERQLDQVKTSIAAATLSARLQGVGGTYTLTVTPQLSTWTGPSYRTTFTCPNR